MHNYNLIQIFLHDFVLNNKFINKSLYEIEKIFYLKKIDIKDENHVFITGMPRSGTTGLLNFLFSSNQYASLRYKNMPFILSPNFSTFFNTKDIASTERSHQDGIFYNMESPEAFDEIFFDNNNKFIKDELLNYVQLILLSENKNKYLSKNNSNIKRIDLIKNLLPNSKFLIPIREPLQQSYSLLNQHINFNYLQKKNNFIKRYMKYLGHHEFGIIHKPWNSPMNHFNKNKIDYWLEQWLLFYEKIYDKFQNNHNCYFLIYEKLENMDYILSLFEKISLKKNLISKLDYFKNSNKKNINIFYNEHLYNKTVSIYEKFLNSTS
tara:strand:+ start:2614 stop:3579 length:966 start_codon:yes stop_codon:yes gene_type:complete